MLIKSEVDPYNWYPPSKIYFSLEQIDFLLDNLQLLLLGLYPTEPSSYTDTANIQKSRSFKAPFETAIQIAAELTIRIQVCGKDGLLTLEHYAQGIGIEELAVLHFKEEDWVERRIRKVRNYISYHQDARPWVDRKYNDKETGEKKESKGKTYKEWLDENKWKRAIR